MQIKVPLSLGAHMVRTSAILFCLVLLHGVRAATLDIFWIDAEGGAATLIVTPAGESILIDSGNPGTRDPQRIFNVATEQAGVRRIDYLITTHYHRDHFGGASTLAKLMPIGVVYDNGRFPDMPDDPGLDYWSFPCAARKVMHPGEALPLKQTAEKPISLRCLGTRRTFAESTSSDPDNATVCDTHRPKQRDGSDNANSVSMLLEYQGFRFLDNGDLTWNQEVQLVCPENRIGEVDVYQVTHHGLDSSNNPVVLNSVRPTVSVMNNGVRKGCSPDVFANLTACDSIQAMYQLHKNLRPDGEVNNAPDEYIANRGRDDCVGNFVKLSVAASGDEYTVSIPANNHARTFRTKQTSTTASTTESTTEKARYQHDQQILLWPEGAPGAKGNRPIDQPALTVHFPKPETANGAAMIVNPGGGYRVLAADHEGLQVARELNRQGITAFVLRYRLKPVYTTEDALADAQRAIRYVRSHAGELNVDPNRIGMMGFSAGGHLTSNAATNFDDGNQNSSDPVERVSSRPDFTAMIYPAISGKLFDRPREYPSTNEQVTEATPPAFLAHTHQDGLSPNHSIYFYQELLKRKIPAELHIFGYGPHGTGLAPGDPDLGRWPGLLANWLRRSGFLTAKHRVAIRGTVLLDDKPLYWGWLKLTPEDPNAPVVTSYIEWGKQGKFSVAESAGPVAGKYRVDVYRVASDFSDKTSGGYTLTDAEQFGSGHVEPEFLEIGPDLPSDLTIEVTSPEREAERD